MIWMREFTRVAVKDAIVFHTGREQMIKATIQFYENPNQRLLTKIIETLITSKIERLLKGPKFSLAHLGSYSKAPSPFKRQNVNLNSSPTDKVFGGGRGWSSPVRRGGINYRGRGRGKTITHNPNFEIPSPWQLTSMWANPIAASETITVASLIGNIGVRSGFNINKSHANNKFTVFPLKSKILL